MAVQLLHCSMMEENATSLADESRRGTDTDTAERKGSKATPVDTIRFVGVNGMAGKSCWEARFCVDVDIFKALTLER